MTRDNIQIGMGHRSLNTRIDVYLSEVGFGLNPAQLRRARLRQIITLECASDAELASLGIRRDDILPFVFRDLLAA
ncbi:hypothetical protein ANTHELSMS3_04193 [Antarctobacter heliothermus]|uniref:DUF1127 domain-containing protein n=1 Tax=Antarctobacter heliothermus TaxID=74033 RepID=A0A222E9B2_9RHOB|nr:MULTISPECIES: hypothetical protein [Antarctobacter]ASP22797.1 hypothetical protein ANTHELSMS3_04193 [Antarctobacter heliothermus]MBT54955.1 hypothetical protein [Mameliella sp.]|tara:strand:- start:7365 stop:7592 length:228 start_codon:yes stop_codon:yes gene_type:complete